MRIRPLLLLLALASVAPLAVAGSPGAGQASPTVDATPRATTSRERPDVDRHCLRETGTRIRLRGERGACAPFAGRVWTRDDLDSTGEVDIANALRRLDVSIR